MCGIAGILSLGGAPPSMEELRAMCGVMSHRGPDSDGFYLRDGAGLAMRRLRIIDLETGDQPVCSGDRSVWTVFNGEIYNFAELRRSLETRGHRFRTSSDTETIVHLYEELGPRCVERMRGMFAFAVWDDRRRRLLLARDRLGIKPLYYAVAGGRLLFASEVKALLQLPGAPRGLSWSAVGHLFAALSTPPDQSIVEGIRKLEPGHVLVAEPGGAVRIERYWEFRIEPDRSRSEAWFRERLAETLEESVRLHLVSDVPVGAFLSGGVDSTAVAAAAARVREEPLKTFSVGFADAAYDETPHAREAARRIGTEHREILVGPEAAGEISDVVWYLDEPFGDPSAIPTYMVAKLAARHVKVVLSGDGGDELFAGYEKYLVERSERRLGLVPPALRRLIGALAARLPRRARGRNYMRHISLPDEERYLDAITLFRPDEQSRLFRPEVGRLLAGSDPWREEAARLRRAGRHWLAAIQMLDVRRYLPLDILTKVDRMTMAHSLEARVPLLDHRLVELAATIPPEMNLQGSSTKRVFKGALEGIVPAEILTRQKHGFAVPLGGWLRGPLRGFARDVLLSDTTRSRGLFDPRRAEEILEDHARGRAMDLHIWTMISLELWCRAFLDARAAGPSRARGADERAASSRWTLAPTAPTTACAPTT